jgi:L-ascorbate oxidase
LLLVNDINPGPVLRANVGDTVRVTLINHSPNEAVSIHYHGLSMLGQPYADGVGSQSQCSTGPMQTAVNEFIALNVGTHYWHGHTSLDRLDGLQGAIIIDDPDDLQEQALKEMYDEERIVFLQDWYHRAGPSQRTGLDSEPFIWIGNAQSFLINGLGRFSGCLDGTSPSCVANCTLEDYVSSIDVEEGKTYRLRIINAASLVSINFAISNHNLTIVEADGTITEPVDVANLDVTVAQRYSVLVTANQAPDSYWATTTIRWRNAGPMGFAYLKYGDAAPPAEDGSLPDHPAWDDVVAGPALDAKLFTKNPKAYPTNVLNSTVDRELIILGTQARRASDNQLRWACNNVTMQFPAEPLIVQAYRAFNNQELALSWPDDDIPGTVVVPDTPPVTFNYTETFLAEGIGSLNAENGVAIMKFVLDEVVDLVLQNARALNGVVEMHAWHLHGHSFWVVGQGAGVFDPDTDPANYNLINPLRRDTVSLWPLGWTAIRFRTDNVGVWPFHCSMNAHSVMGMGFTMVTSPELLPPPPPGATSCLRNSVAEADAEQCTLLSDIAMEVGDSDVPYITFPNTKYPSVTPAPSKSPSDGATGSIPRLSLCAVLLFMVALVGGV